MASELSVPQAILGSVQLSRIYAYPKTESRRGPSETSEMNRKLSQKILTEQQLLYYMPISRAQLCFLCHRFHSCSYIPTMIWNSFNGQIHVGSITVALTWSTQIPKTNIYLESNYYSLVSRFSTDKE